MGVEQVELYQIHGPIGEFEEGCVYEDYEGEDEEGREEKEGREKEGGTDERVVLGLFLALALDR